MFKSLMLSLMLVLMISACGGGEEEQNATAKTVVQDMNTTDVTIVEETNITENVLDEDVNITAIIVEAETKTTETIVETEEIDESQTEKTIVQPAEQNTTQVETPVVETVEPVVTPQNEPLKINGYTLPPEPDPSINNATVLGVDSNDNGVRDDVEIWIYTTYTEPVERGLFMQSARAYQKVIEDPTQAKETTKYIDDSYSCEAYWTYHAKGNNESFSLNRYRDLEKEIGDVQFNTLERHIAYKRFNGEFSGEVFSSPSASKEKCEFDDNGILRP